MPPSAQDRLADILRAIERIERATRDMSAAQFVEDELVFPKLQNVFFKSRIMRDAFKRLKHEVFKSIQALDN